MGRVPAGEAPGDKTVVQGNVTPGGQQVPRAEVRLAPVSRPSPIGAGAGSSQPQQAAPVGRAVSAAATAAAQKPVSAEVVEALAKELNQKMDFNKFQAQVRVDEGSNKVIISILSRDTGKVIRQLPPEGILLLAEKLHKAGPGGVLFDAHI